MSDTTVPDVAKEEEKQQGKWYDGIDPVAAAVDVVTYSLSSPVCNTPNPPIAPPTTPADPAALADAAPEGGSSILSDVADGIGDAVGSLLDGV